MYFKKTHFKTVVDVTFVAEPHVMFEKKKTHQQDLPYSSLVVVYSQLCLAMTKSLLQVLAATWTVHTVKRTNQKNSSVPQITSYRWQRTFFQGSAGRSPAMDLRSAEAGPQRIPPRWTKNAAWPCPFWTAGLGGWSLVRCGWRMLGVGYELQGWLSWLYYREPQLSYTWKLWSFRSDNQKLCAYHESL